MNLRNTVRPADARAHLDQLTKPQGSLGRLEDLAAQIAVLQGTLQPAIVAPVALVFAADHGVADIGVSAYPKAVTAQMVLNFLAGGAAISVLARANDFALRIVDAGVDADFAAHPLLIDAKLGRGTRNYVDAPAMTAADYTAALERAARIVADCGTGGCNTLLLGEMGIGKTALVKAFTSELPGDARIVEIECSPVQSELPLATVSDLLRTVTGIGPESSIDDASTQLRELLGGSARSTHAPRIVARLAELVTGKQLEHGDEDAVSYRRDIVLLGVRALLGNLARTSPLVIVIDGLQWADRPSLEVLQDLLKRKEARPILVLLVTRPDERVAPFLEGLVRIELRGLSADEQMRLVEARLGVRQGVAAVCRELVPRVAGNPFFLLEMIDALLTKAA